MKRLIFLLMTLLFIYSCGPNDNLIRIAEKWLLTQLNDPDSYKRESFVITEIVTNDDVPIKQNEQILKSVEGIIETQNQHLELLLSLGEKDDVTIFNLKKSIDTLNIEKQSYLNKIDSLRKNKDKNSEIFTILFLATYRAKNSFGGYVKEQTKIRYYYSSKEFEIVNDNKDEPWKILPY